MGRMVVAIGMPFDRAVGIGNERRTILHRLGYGNRRNAILIGQSIAIQAVQPQLPIHAHDHAHHPAPATPPPAAALPA